MPRSIHEWQWDDDNLEHLARHGLNRRIVLEVATTSPRFRRNRKARAATHQMIGPDLGGAFWTICIAEIPAFSGVWRAITGWPAEEHEIDWYRRH